MPVRDEFVMGWVMNSYKRGIRLGALSILAGLSDFLNCANIQPLEGK